MFDDDETGSRHAVYGKYVDYEHASFNTSQGGGAAVNETLFELSRG